MVFSIPAAHITPRSNRKTSQRGEIILVITNLISQYPMIKMYSVFKKLGSTIKFLWVTKSDQQLTVIWEVVLQYTSKSKGGTPHLGFLFGSLGYLEEA